MTESLPGKIRISDLQLRCIIGIYPEERREKQDIVIHVELDAELGRAVETDCIDDTVDYKTLKKRIIHEVEQSQYLLIERLAGRVSELCLEDPKVNAVRVQVEKPGALRFARTVSVEIYRARAR